MLSYVLVRRTYTCSCTKYLDRGFQELQYSSRNVGDFLCMHVCSFDRIKNNTIVRKMFIYENADFEIVLFLGRLNVCISRLAMTF